jgi:hypothetical protein
MNGNITEEGIRLDLEWMHRIGIAGFQQFDAALATPQVVDKRVVHMTPGGSTPSNTPSRLIRSRGVSSAACRACLCSASEGLCGGVVRV